MPRKHSALLVLALLFSGTTLAVAGRLFACPKAVSSEDGNFLVISNVDFQHLSSGQLRLERVSLEVFPKEQFVNAKDRFATNATLWTDIAPNPWSLVLSSIPMHNIPECVLPLITNDGEFIVLVHVGGLFTPQDVVLQVYRRDQQWNPNELTGYRGKLVREIPLREIWSPLEIANNTGMWDDHTPEWFSGGTFEFSSDSRRLKHKTRWGYAAQVNLEDGSVSRTP